jgi:C4-dicarboxylate-specific signal transduction histidine kinase
MWYSQRFSAIEDAGQGIIGMMIIETDVTEKLKLAEEVEVERAKAMHATKFATLGEMASGIAHEINTPLSHIQLLAAMLKERAQAGSIVAEDVRGIADQVDGTVARITKTVTTLRSFARQCDGDPFKRVQVADVLGETLELMRERLRVADVELRIVPFSPGMMIECRSTQVTQILLNLCANAIDAQEGREKRWLQIEVKDLGMSVEISVSDGGPGIPKVMREKIMQPFFTTKGAGKGTWLGLSVSKGIAGFHHGLLYLDEAAANTRFVLLLPKLQPVKQAG